MRTSAVISKHLYMASLRRYIWYRRLSFGGIFDCNNLRISILACV